MTNPFVSPKTISGIFFAFFAKSSFPSSSAPFTIMRTDTIFLLVKTRNLMNTPCKHLQVRFVSREEDAEFVECVNCGEIFDAAELRDIAAEEVEAPAEAEES